jgi:hypothetical protein
MTRVSRVRSFQSIFGKELVCTGDLNDLEETKINDVLAVLVPMPRPIVITDSDESGTLAHQRHAMTKVFQSISMYSLRAAIARSGSASNKTAAFRLFGSGGKKDAIITAILFPELFGANQRRNR